MTAHRRTQPKVRTTAGGVRQTRFAGMKSWAASTNEGWKVVARALAGATLLATAGPALVRTAKACSCAPASRAEHRRNSDAAFLGRVLRVEDEPKSSQCDIEGITRPELEPPPPPAARRAEPGTGCIEGTVGLAYCETPLAAVTVQVADQTTWSDAAGNFRVCGIAPGEYELAAGRDEAEVWTRVHVAADATTPTALNITEMVTLGPSWRRAQIRVTAASKGVRVGQRIWVYTPNSTCGFFMPKGGLVRVRASRQRGDGRLWAGLCSGSKVLTRRRRVRGPRR